MDNIVKSNSKIPESTVLLSRHTWLVSTIMPPKNEPVTVVVDKYRSIVFPNRVREQRIRQGHANLFAFATKLSNITYNRLERIEKGAVYARVEELLWIGSALNILPRDLILDVAAAHRFDMAVWLEPFADTVAFETDEEATFAILLAAAVRTRRFSEATFSGKVMDRVYGLPTVMLSQIEDAQKTLGQWSDETIGNLCSFFGLADEMALRRYVAEQYLSGGLNRLLCSVPTSESREARTRLKIADLLTELSQLERNQQSGTPSNNVSSSTRRMVAVFSFPNAPGLISTIATGTEVEAPSWTGDRTFGLRIGRSPIGFGLPDFSILIVDPDYALQDGGLVVVKQDDGYHILSVTLAEDGTRVGYSSVKSLKVPLDGLAADATAVIVAALFI